MSQITVTRTIEAPLPFVFQTISDIRNFSKAVPDITDVEFLSEQRSGAGTRFRETRDMNGREASTVLEVTEYRENGSIRLVSDAGGTKWDSVFSVEPTDSGTRLTLAMEARPYKLLAKLASPLMKGMIRKALEKDMDAVKEYCENR